jgi:polysaccharide chain length determinant protein (PEP-CTERM system associated)
VQAVLSVFSEQTQKTSLGDVESAKRFIDNQIRKYEQRLRNAERAKENFKRENIGLLPGQEGEGQFNVIRTIRRAIEDVQMQLSEMLSRKKVLQLQLSEALESGEEWGLTEIVNTNSVEDSRITELEHRKSDLLLKFTDNHPVISTINKEIDALRKRKEENDNQNALDENGDSNPYQAMSSTYTQSIKIELNRIEVEIATHISRIASLKKKLQKEDEQFNERLATETEMQNLNRDYEAIKKNYLTLIERREKATLSSNVDSQVSALKFKIADPANVPLEPSAPNRMLLYSVILGLGFLLGAALALLKVFIRPSFIEAKQVKEFTELPVLGTISEVVSDAQTKNNFFRLIGFISVNVLLIVGYSGMMLIDVLS